MSCEMTDVWVNKIFYTSTEPQHIVHICPVYYHEKNSGSLVNSKTSAATGVCECSSERERERKEEKKKKEKKRGILSNQGPLYNCPENIYQFFSSQN